MKQLFTLFFVLIIGVSAWGQASYTGTSPDVDTGTVGTTTCTVRTSINTNNYVTSFIILTSTDPVPTIQNVLDWSFDGNGGTLSPGTYGDIHTSIFRPLFVSSDANTTYSKNITNLIPSTDYVAYFVSTTNWNAVTTIETSNPTSYSFTTLAAPIPPSITTLNPLDGATDVAVNQSLQITFNENIVRGTSGIFTIYEEGTPTASYLYNSGNVSITNNTLTVTHATFNYATNYYITIDAGFVKSQATDTNFPGISNTTDWNFTTVVANPQWDSGYPNITSPTKTEVTVNGQVDKAGNYYLVLTQSATSPSPAQIKLGNNESDVSALDFLTDVVTANTTFSPSFDITSLSSETQYWVHVVTEDGTSKFSSVQSRTFTTQDTQAPAYALDSPDVEIIGGTGVYINLEINENGQSYFVILPSGATAPSPSQVKLGRDANNDSAPFSDNLPLTANDQILFPVFGLTPSTDYVAYIVSADNNGNDIEISSATAIPFTTPGPPPGIISYLPLQNATGVPISQSLQLTFDENIQLAGGSTKRVYIMHSIDDTEFISYPRRNPNITISGSTLTIAHVPFAENTSYYVIMEDRFVESAVTGGAFEGFSNPTDWTFTTETLPAQWASGFPTIGIPTKTSVVVNGQVNKTGTYYLVVTQSATAPSAAQVKLGQDETNAVALLTATGASVAATTFNPPLDISALETQTQYYVYVVAETTPDKFSTVEQLTFTTVQTSWAATYPKIQNQTKTSMDVLGQVDAAGAYHLVVTTSATAPTEAQIIAGENELGVPALLPTTAIVTANTEFTANLNLSSLSSLANYWVHIVVLDEFGNYTSIVTLPFIQQDTEAPVYTSPTPEFTNITGNGATLEVEINEDGRVYFVVLLESAGAPSIAQVLAGTDSDNNPVNEFGGSTTLSANERRQVTASNCTSQTSYIAYLVTRDSNGNYIETGTPTEIPFTTLDITAPVATFDPANEEVDVLLDKTITITLSEEVYRNSTGILITNDNVGEIVSLREDGPGGAIVTATVTYDEDNFIITIDPTGNLKELQLYNINLRSLRDETGNILSAQNSIFTTQDITSPVTNFVSPVSNEAGFPINAPLTVGFNEAIRNLDGTAITDLDLQTLISFSPTVTFTASINAEGNMITITPDANLAQSTIYSLTMGMVEDIYGNEQLSISSINFTTDSYQIWNGSTSDVFTETSNWTGAGNSVVIPQSATNQPVVYSSIMVSVNNVIIEAGASLTIAPAGKLTITKSLELKSSVNSAIGNANLLINGTLTTTGAKVNVEQVIQPNLKRLYISSPVIGSTQANTGISNSIYRRNATIAAWELLTSSEVMQTGVGYVAYGNAGDIINFNGALNNDEVGPITTVRTTSPNNYGWNLTGNPYPCSIDWEGISTNYMRDRFYILNNDSELYGIYNGNNGGGATYVNVNTDNPSHIPSCHSFWTQVEIGETIGDITIPKSARVNSHYTYLKNAKVSNSQQIRFAGINSEDVKDEILISFDANASDEVDSFDAEKRFSDNKKVMQFYALQSSQKLAINTYSNYEAGRSIELGYRVGQVGDYKLALIELLNAEESAIIKIEDKLNGTLKTMNLNDEYSFTTDAGTFENRFVVHITPTTATAVNTIEDNYPINIYSSGSYIYIKTPELTKPYYQVYNTSGRLLQSGLLQAQVENKIYSEHEGLLLIKIISSEKTMSEKVFVKN